MAYAAGVQGQYITARISNVVVCFAYVAQVTGHSIYIALISSQGDTSRVELRIMFKSIICLE